MAATTIMKNIRAIQQSHICILSPLSLAKTGWAMLFLPPPPPSPLLPAVSLCLSLFLPSSHPHSPSLPPFSRFHWATSAAWEYHPSPSLQPPEAIANPQPAHNCQLTKLFSQQESQAGRESYRLERRQTDGEFLKKIESPKQKESEGEEEAEETDVNALCPFPPVFLDII